MVSPELHLYPGKGCAPFAGIFGPVAVASLTETLMGSMVTAPDRWLRIAAIGLPDHVPSTSDYFRIPGTLAFTDPVHFSFGAGPHTQIPVYELVDPWSALSVYLLKSGSVSPVAVRLIGWYLPAGWRP